MATWIKLSNGHETCQTHPTEKVIADWIAAGLPIDIYGELTYPRINSPEMRTKYNEITNKHLEIELNDYIDQKFPDQGVTLIERKNLPYGSTPAFGSGSKAGHFCYTPRECAGRGSCPKSYACSK